MWVAIPLDIILALVMMRVAAFGAMKENVAATRHLWQQEHGR